jgi:Domain of unknown function (DUF6378)
LVDKNVAVDAVRLVMNERNKDYGPASESFARTGKAMGALLHLDRDLTPQEVAMFFIIHKLSRETYKAKRDNRVDIIGYTLLLDEIQEMP